MRAALTTAFHRLRARLPRQRGPRDVAVLVFVLVLAAILRLLPTPEGLPYLHEWDEPQIASTALHMMKTGDLDPHFFHYGSLTIYAQLGVDVVHFFYLMRREPVAFPVEPGRFEQEEIDLDAIETYFETGFLWEVSHPSFYLWNRAFNALLGTATVFVTFLLGRLLAGRTAGLLAAALLAVQGFHVELSAIVNPDVAMALAALAAIWASVAFAERGRSWTLVAALACCGLAASAKYNGVFSLVAPMAALVLARRRHGASPWLWAAVPAVPAIAFLATTPFALLDLPSFLAQAGFELYHYAARGHGAVPVEPGWAHLALETRRVGEHFGVVPALLALAGAVLASRRASGLVAFVYPFVYFLYMAGTRAEFHRNLLVVYPALAVAAAVAVLHALEWLAKPPALRRRRAARLALAVGVPVYLGFLAFGLARAGWRQWEGRETRSLAVDAVNEMTRSGGAARVGIARELRVHRLDLARLEPPWEVLPHLDLVCAAADFDVIVTGARYAGLWSAKPEAKREARRLNAASLGEPERLIGGPLVGHNVTWLDARSRDPAVAVYRVRKDALRLPAACSQVLSAGG